jgi:hypothetical protein
MLAAHGWGLGLDGSYFRRRAAEAREMAALGEDVQLSRLLLEVARDLEAEADDIEAGIARDRRSAVRVPGNGTAVLLRPAAEDAVALAMILADFSATGARLQGEAGVSPGETVLLSIPAHAAQFAAQVVRVEAGILAVEFAKDLPTRQRAVQVYRNLVAAGPSPQGA